MFDETQKESKDHIEPQQKHQQKFQLADNVYQ